MYVSTYAYWFIIYREVSTFQFQLGWSCSLKDRSLLQPIFCFSFSNILWSSLSLPPSIHPSIHPTRRFLWKSICSSFTVHSDSDSTSGDNLFLHNSHIPFAFCSDLYSPGPFTDSWLFSVPVMPSQMNDIVLSWPEQSETSRKLRSLHEESHLWRVFWLSFPLVCRWNNFPRQCMSMYQGVVWHNSIPHLWPLLVLQNLSRVG